MRMRGIPEVCMQNNSVFGYSHGAHVDVVTVNMPRAQVKHGFGSLGPVMNYKLLEPESAVLKF